MVQSIVTAIAAVLAAVVLHAVEAQSKMTVPKPNGEMSDAPSGFIDGFTTLEMPAGMTFFGRPDQNQVAFQKAFEKQTTYTSLRAMVYANFQPFGASTKECGASAMAGTPQALPAFVEYGNGFPQTHLGPCEVWCDDVRVFADPNCRANFPTAPAKLPYVKAQCIGAQRLQSFWLSVHVPKWPVHIACATLSGNRMLRKE